MKQKGFKPRASYCPQKDVLIVITQGCPANFSINDEAPRLGSVMYVSTATNSGAIGFTVHGVRQTLSEKGRTPRMNTPVDQLVHLLASATKGGFHALFGDSAADVRKILREHGNLPIRFAR